MCHLVFLHHLLIFILSYLLLFAVVYCTFQKFVWYFSVCFSSSSYLLVDPCEREERVMDGLLVIAVNKHREICSIQSSGGIMLLKDQVTARIC